MEQFVVARWVAGTREYLLDLQVMPNGVQAPRITMERDKALRLTSTVAGMVARDLNRQKAKATLPWIAVDIDPLQLPL